MDPEQLGVLSNFQLELRLSNNVRRIRLNMQLDRKTISPVAEYRYLGSEATRDSSNHLLEGSTLLFEGDALLFDHGRRRWRKAGWAWIIIQPQVRPRLFEGTFSLDDDYYHVLLDSNYRKTRREGDPLLPESTSPHMVVWSQSNLAER